MIVSRFNMVVVCFTMTLLSIAYLLSESDNVAKPSIVNINISSSKGQSYHEYAYDLTDKFIPGFIGKIFDKAQPPATCLIVIRSADGALGNRMFLFASAYGLARLHQCDLYVAPWIIRDLRSTFTIHLNETPVHLINNDSLVNRTDFYQRYSACTLFDDLLKIPLHQNLTSYELVGFYQAFGYFVKYRDEISYLYQFNQPTIKNLVPLVEQLVKAIWKIPLDLKNYTIQNVTHQYLKRVLTRPEKPLIPVTWISIHIRRGDFLTFFKLDTNLAYLNLAMNHYRRKYMNCRFLIASDDKDYVRKNLGHHPDIFVTPDSYFHGDDMGSLALCEHSIVTAGSYGWWSAWLAGGNVIHDIHYPVPFQKCIREHYFPPWFIFPRNDSYVGISTQTP